MKIRGYFMVCFCAILPPYTLNPDYFHQTHTALVFWNIFLFWLIRMFYQLSFQICIKLRKEHTKFVFPLVCFVF